MPEWVAPIIGLAGVVIGVVITEFRQWRERKEKYVSMIFEKRLQVHQEAYGLCRQLQKDIVLLPGKGVTYKKCKDDARKLRDWVFDNCLYLDQKSVEAIPEMIVVVLDRMDDIKAEKEIEDIKDEKEKAVKKLAVALRESQVGSKIRKTLECIANGIGVKYLPEFEK